MIFFSINQDVG